MHGAGADAFEGEDELAALMTGSQRQHTPLAALAAREYNINMDMNAHAVGICELLTETDKACTAGWFCIDTGPPTCSDPSCGLDLRMSWSSDQR